MRYRISTRRGGVKEVVWDIPETHSSDRYPTFAEISEAVAKEFSEYQPNELAVIPTGGGDMVILMLARYA
ncbi:MAG: hypothetical protein HYT63_02040 [Candidatus Yanofskybacteria bacterium]|nr:hypothetical protein [Candidatus Yanofskybacteria bacterium]